MGANEKSNAAYYGEDKPKYGELKDPSEKKEDWTLSPSPILAIPPEHTDEEWAKAGRKVVVTPTPRPPAGRTANIVAGLVALAVVAPFVLLLWRWALGVVF